MIVWHRIRADFLMRPRLGEYAHLLGTARSAGYRVVGIEQFWSAGVGRSDSPGGRWLVLRHDVDTDPGTAGEMWRIERVLGIASSYFFRLATVDIPLMSSIAAEGGGVGYHYEELATIAKRRRLRTREEALQAIPEARELFATNLEQLRVATGLPLRVAASHGDFVNRKLGVPNWMILGDGAFRREIGIDLEGYDEELLQRLPVRSADTAPPRCWVPHSPLEAIERDEQVVYALVHPRHWRVARLVNARDDLQRAREGLTFSRPRLRCVDRGGER